MKFKFLGTDECPKEITLRGVKFTKGRGVEVDEELAEKLANLDFFRVVKPRDKNKH